MQRLLVRAIANALFAVDDRPLQLVFHRQRVNVRRRMLFFALGPGKVIHINLQRIAIRLIVENQLARQINFRFRNFVQRINLAVIHDGHVEAVVDRLVHEDAVQNSPRVDIQTERNVADAKDRLHFGKLGLDRLHGFQRLDAGGAVVFLAGRDRQCKRVEDQITRTNAVLVHRQIEDALRNGQLFLPGHRRVERIRHSVRPCIALRLPLVRTRWALGQFPFVAKQVREETVAPPRRRAGPDDFQPAGDRVAALAVAKAVPPAQALLLDSGALRLGSHIGRRTSTVSLPEGMAASDQRDCLFVVHSHTGKGLAYIVSRGSGVRIAIRALRIDIDQAHLYCGERILQFAFVRSGAGPIFLDAMHLHVGHDHALVAMLSLTVAYVAAQFTSTVSVPQQHPRPAPTSSRPPPKPKVLKPIDSSATLPVRMIRSAHEILLPYFCLIGQINRRALSRLTLSGQQSRGAKRCWPDPAPPRPSPTRYVPALCHAMRMNRPP